MKKLYLMTALLFLWTVSCKQAEKQPAQSVETTEKKVAAAPPALTAEEKAAGFKLLFNGTNTEGWHVYKKDTSSWQIADYVLFTKGGHGDLVTNAAFENFELVFDWKLPKAGNSGVIYMVQDEMQLERTWHTGVEYQLIDDKGWNGELHGSQKPGAAYDLYDPMAASALDAGEWNTGRIVSNKGHIEHYLNGKKTADYIWDSDDFKARVAKSKFKDLPFAKKLKGHIVFQDHGQGVAFRNVKIRTL